MQKKGRGRGDGGEYCKINRDRVIICFWLFQIQEKRWLYFLCFLGLCQPFLYRMGKNPCCITHTLCLFLGAMQPQESTTTSLSNLFFFYGDIMLGLVSNALPIGFSKQRATHPLVGHSQIAQHPSTIIYDPFLFSMHFTLRFQFIDG